jgi:hypothetical protein
MITRIVALTLLAVTSFSGAAAAAKPQDQPPPYVAIMPQYDTDGSYGTNKNIEFDAYAFNTGKNKQSETAEGVIWQRTYKLKPNLPQNPSSQQVAADFADALRSLGSANVVEFNHYSELAHSIYGGDMRAVFGKFIKDGKEIWVEVQIGDGKYALTILEKGEMRQDIGMKKPAQKAGPAPSPQS